MAQSTFASVCSRRTSSGTAADAFADDAARPDDRAAAPSPSRVTRAAPSCAGLRLERLLLRRHDVLERRIARTRDAFVDRDRRRQREFDDLRRALELATRRAAAVRDVELRRRGDARNAEQLAPSPCRRRRRTCRTRACRTARDRSRRPSARRRAPSRRRVRRTGTASVLSCTARSAPMLIALRSVSCTASGPTAKTTVSPGPCFSLSCSATSTA